MRHSDVSKTRRTAAGIMSLILLVIVLFSAFYIAAEADHECTGEDCPVCCCIRQCRNTMTGLEYRTAAKAIAFIPFIFIPFITVLPVIILPQETLVTKRIRLNN